MILILYCFAFSISYFTFRHLTIIQNYVQNMSLYVLHTYVIHVMVCMYVYDKTQCKYVNCVKSNILIMSLYVLQTYVIHVMYMWKKISIIQLASICMCVCTYIAKICSFHHLTGISFANISFTSNYLLPDIYYVTECNGLGK